MSAMSKKSQGSDLLKGLVTEVIKFKKCFPLSMGRPFADALYAELASQGLIQPATEDQVVLRKRIVDVLKNGAGPLQVLIGETARKLREHPDTLKLFACFRKMLHANKKLALATDVQLTSLIHSSISFAAQMLAVVVAGAVGALRKKAFQQKIMHNIVFLIAIGGFLEVFKQERAAKRPKTTKTSKNKKTVYLIHYPGVGWLVLPPRNDVTETQHQLQMVYRQYRAKEAVGIVKAMFMGMIGKSPVKLIDRYVKKSQIDGPYRIVKFKYHPETDVMESDKHVTQQSNTKKKFTS